jgi:hypothetical protein
MASGEPVIGAFVSTPTAGEEPAAALARVRELLAAQVPGLDPALIHGATLDEVEESFAALKKLAAPPAVPAGAPGRAVHPPATPFEKIREGLARLAG